MLGSENLTATTSTELSTVRGMAHFAGTGPEGKTCHDCKFRGYRRVQGAGIWGNVLDSFYRYYGCAKFFMLTGNHGPAIKWQSPGGYPAACKYFINRPERKLHTKYGAGNSSG